MILKRSFCGSVFYLRMFGMGLLKINGKEQEFADGKMPATIAELLSALGVDSATVVAELDGQIIERKNFSTTPLHAGQNVELVRFVGGG